MLSPQLLRRIRRIELKSKRLVQNAFAGAYQSVYKGRGLSFSAVRPYQPGDDVRSIDWKVTARTGEPFIKQYIEERELTLLIVIDGSASVLSALFADKSPSGWGWAVCEMGVSWLGVSSWRRVADRLFTAEAVFIRGSVDLLAVVMAG